MLPVIYWRSVVPVANIHYGESVMICKGLIALLSLVLMASVPVRAIEYPCPTHPGPPKVVSQDDHITISNNLLRLRITSRGRSIRPVEFVNLLTQQRIAGMKGEFFKITAAPEGASYCCSEFIVQGDCHISNINPEPDSRTIARRMSGRLVRARLVSTDGRVAVEWSLELREGSNYVRQFIEVFPSDKPVRVTRVQFWDMSIEDAYVSGTILGSPIVSGDCFLAYEHPNATNSVSEGSRAVCRLDRDTMLDPGKSLKQSSVIGVVPAGQLRRGFLHYIERERISAYRPFLHYNSWYDIAWGGREKMNSDECVQVIENYGTELVEKRTVQLDSLVFDDGWDDPKTLWQVLKQNFPEGFSPLQKTAAKYGTHIGLWLSPWGGYGQAKTDRLTYGKTQGFETGKAGFSLTGARYYDRFRESCVRFVEQYEVNFFKFDGMDAALLNETEALLRLCDELYCLNDEMYISLTTGTWASPFWLLHADSVWRGGGDMGFHGPGPKREQWLTYRDKITYKNMVNGGPLYPLNSFMNQGIAHSIWGSANLPADPEQFAHEAYSFFAIGTGLQELYVAPSRMTEEMWDILAEGARWSRRNSQVLVDTHWIGGDPDKLQIYGCASFANGKAILMLRNPANRKQGISLDITEALEVPAHLIRERVLNKKTSYVLTSLWQGDRNAPAIIGEIGTIHEFELEPFEVIVLESPDTQ